MHQIAFLQLYIHNRQEWVVIASSDIAIVGQ